MINGLKRAVHVRRLAVPSILLVVAVLLGACGETQDPTDYAIENRNDFLTACARPLDDPRLLNDVCACTYDRIEAEYRFDEFAELDEELVAARLAESTQAAAGGATSGLPQEIIDIVADCFVEEAGL